MPVFDLGTEVAPPEIARQGLKKAKADGVDVVIVDTAGRLVGLYKLRIQLTRALESAAPGFNPRAAL